MTVSDWLPAACGANSQSLKVTETDPLTDPRWEAFVLEHPNGSIYHHPGWLGALESEYHQETVYLICENAEGQVLSILPMAQTRGLPFGVGGPLGGRRLSSLPRTPIGGPLSNDPSATSALLQETVQRVISNPGVQLQLKTQERELDGLIDGVVSTPWRMSYILELPPNSAAPFRISDSNNRSAVKRAINKAEKQGVQVRPAETEAELKAWYWLYLDSMRRNVVPPRPYRFFAALWQLLRPKGMMELLIAEHHVMGRRRIIAGSVFLSFRDTVSYAFGGSGFGDISLRPNDVIMWQAINDACRRGFHRFDFGEVPEGDDDLARFKKKWGAEPVRMYRYYYPARPEVEASSHESGGNVLSLGKAVWRRMPLRATAWIGDLLYSRL
jgi:hypothetical protein